MSEPEPYTLTDALTNIEIVTDSSALTSLRRAELDRQGDTARAHGRSVTRFREKILEYCTYSEAVAASCIYSIPRGGKTITGATVRFAELVLQAWGNIDVTVTLLSVDKEAAVLQGRCTDHETNVSTSLVARRRVTFKSQKMIEDAKQLAVASGGAIAKRNAILSVVPKVFWEDAFLAAVDASLGKGTISDRRNRAIDWFVAQGATEHQVYAAVERAGFDDLTIEDLRYLSGVRTSIKNKTTTLADALRPPSKEKPRGPAHAAPSTLSDKLPAPPEREQEPAAYDPDTGEVHPG